MHLERQATISDLGIGILKNDALAGGPATSSTQIGFEESRISRLASLPKLELSRFLDDLTHWRRRVPHFSRTNCASAIWDLHHLMNADGRNESREFTDDSV